MYFKLQLLILLLYIIQTIISKPLNKKAEKEIRKTDELSDDIAIIHLNDVHCGVNDAIGYDGFVLYRRELQKKYKHVISIDVGDHIQGGALGSISEGEAIIRIMNKIQFNVSTLGNHEFDYGIQQLTKLGENITSKYICANFCYRKNKTHVYEPYKIIEVGKKKIGFIGVITPLTFSKTYLSSIKDETGEPLYDFLVNNGKQELYNKIQEYIDELRTKAKVDHVILLTHIGMYAEQYTTDDLLSSLSGVDAVLDGHTHLVYNITLKDKDNKDIHITQTGTKLETIGQLIIKEDGSLIAETISSVPKPDDDITGAINVTRSNKERWVDEEMNNFITKVNSEYAKVLNEIIGHSNYELVIKPENSTDSNLIYCRTRECTLGNLISDAILSAGEADFTIVNGGGIRNNLKKGNITKADIIETLPWFNNLVIKELPGQVIIDALEFGVRKYPEPNGGFPQVSSELSYNFNPDINSTVVVDPTGLYLNISGERRVSNVKVNGKNIEPEKNYSVLMFEYLANGGSGFTMFAGYEITREGLVTDTQALSDFIEYNLKGEIPKEYSEIQGRIKITNKTDDSDDETYKPYLKKNKGLSTGAIIAIIIPCVVALVAISAFVLIIRKRSSTINNISSIESKNNIAPKLTKV